MDYTAPMQKPQTLRELGDEMVRDLANAIEYAAPMKLNLRCAICDEVKESQRTTEELVDVSAEDICMCCFICAECSAD